ncbi:MAG TPA: type II toxin-antitoxin system ParD family antitoxin [Tepidisphaeraceae bacterium]|nr:type II toxin-antitoxin system ParD family antitoxin [Tepidisphaeraceae bacterium]
MNVSLTPTLEKFVKIRVKNGRYESASEVMRAGLRALEREESEARYWIEVNEKVREARDDVAAGRVLDGPKAMARILSDLKEGRPLVKSTKRGKR